MKKFSFCNQSDSSSEKHKKTKKCKCRGKRGHTGPGGPAGIQGPRGIQGPPGSLSYAEYVQTVISTNGSVAPGALTAFNFGTTPVVDTIGLNPGQTGLTQGNYFYLPAGVYMIDFEMSLTSSGSIGLYTGSSVANLTLDTKSVAGSTTGTTWIHGRHIITAVIPTYLTVSSVVGTAAVTTAGSDEGNYITRITFLLLGAAPVI